MSIIKFLYGESEFMGYWFGDKPGNEGAFWWRKHLREHDDKRTKELESLKKLYNDLAESHAKQVIEIAEITEREIRELKLYDSQNRSIIRLESEINVLESELLKAKELLTRCRKSNGYHTISLSEDLDEFLDKK